MNAISKRPPAAPKENRSPSGQHPAVKAYRAKLESVAEGGEFDRLDREFEKFLADVKSDPPPRRPA